jgi:Leucine rich repeat
VLSSEALILNCTYSVRSFYRHPDIYACIASVIFVGDPRHVTEVSKNHLAGRSDNDVLGVAIEKQDLKFVPRNISSFFPNVQAFDIRHCGVEDIAKEDISGFKNLSMFQPADNNIRSIPNDMFQGNPSIRAIAVGRNPIRHIAANVFDPLTQLVALWLDPVSCINAQAENRSAVIDLTFLASVSCPPTFEMNFERFQTKLLNGIELEIKIDKQVSERINPLTMTVFELDQKLQEIDERLEVLEREFKTLATMKKTLMNNRV